MLAGLGVVGALLVVLVVFAPGSGQPRLPVQSVHDVSPITASGPKTEAATTPTTAAPSTTSSAPAASTTTTPRQQQGETITTFVTYSRVPGTTPAQTPTTRRRRPGADHDHRSAADDHHDYGATATDDDNHDEALSPRADLLICRAALQLERLIRIAW